MTDYEKLHLLALANTPGIGSVTIKHLIRTCGTPSKIFSTGYRDLVRVKGVGDKIAREIQKRAGLKYAEAEWARCEREGISLCFFTEPDYPQRLRPLYDSPLVLYVRGRPDLNLRYTVGIVGTRKISDYGKQVTETIVRELAAYQPLVVSGLAYGVDVVAHRACVKNQIPTVGVMANGIDLVYPAAHKRIAQEMMANAGGLITENALGTKPDFMRFPARNRVIAGMSDVIIVVESAARGGSLITTAFAQNYHREVFAVPGNVMNPQSEGCNNLIRENKASIFTSVEMMAQAVRWELGNTGAAENDVEKAKMPVFDGFTEEESQVLSLLKRGGEIQIDELSWDSGISPGMLANLLLNLEFQGLIQSQPGKKYKLI